MNLGEMAEADLIVCQSEQSSQSNEVGCLDFQTQAKEGIASKLATENSAIKLDSTSCARERKNCATVSALPHRFKLVLIPKAVLNKPSKQLSVIVDEGRSYNVRITCA